MEENSRARQEDAEEFKEDMATALLLVSLKYEKLDYETGKTLEGMKNQVLKKCQAKTRNPEDEELPIFKAIRNGYSPESLGFSQSIDGSILPDFPPVEQLRGVIGQCSRPFEKQLTESDVKSSQSRLTLNKERVAQAIIPILNDKEDLTEGISVTTYDLRGETYDMLLKIWASKVYVLTRQWKRFFSNHNLRKHEDWVRIWVFRHAQIGKLCVVIVPKRFPTPQPVKFRKHKENNKQCSLRI